MAKAEGSQGSQATATGRVAVATKGQGAAPRPRGAARVAMGRLVAVVGGWVQGMAVVAPAVVLAWLAAEGRAVGGLDGRCIVPVGQSLHALSGWAVLALGLAGMALSVRGVGGSLAPAGLLVTGSAAVALLSGCVPDRWERAAPALALGAATPLAALATRWALRTAEGRELVVAIKSTSLVGKKMRAVGLLVTTALVCKEAYSTVKFFDNVAEPPPSNAAGAVRTALRCANEADLAPGAWLSCSEPAGGGDALVYEPLDGPGDVLLTPLSPVVQVYLTRDGEPYCWWPRELDARGDFVHDLACDYGPGERAAPGLLPGAARVVAINAPFALTQGSALFSVDLTVPADGAFPRALGVPGTDSARVQMTPDVSTVTLLVTLLLALELVSAFVGVSIPAANQDHSVARLLHRGPAGLALSALAAPSPEEAARFSSRGWWLPEGVSATSAAFCSVAAGYIVLVFGDWWNEALVTAVTWDLNLAALSLAATALQSEVCRAQIAAAEAGRMKANVRLQPETEEYGVGEDKDRHGFAVQMMPARDGRGKGWKIVPRGNSVGRTHNAKSTNAFGLRDLLGV